MESAFSETRRAAELLQQFSGFPFCQNNIRLSPLSALGLPCTIPVPAPLFLRGVYLCLGTLDRSVTASWRYFPGEYHLW